MKEETACAHMRTFRHRIDRTYARGNESCSICRCDFESDERLAALKCAHIFHQECLMRWIAVKAKCPACLMDLRKPAREVPYLKTNVRASSLPSPPPPAVRLAAKRSSERTRIRRNAEAAGFSIEDLPYEGDVRRAMVAGDREAVRVLLKIRDRGA